MVKLPDGIRSVAEMAERDELNGDAEPPPKKVKTKSRTKPKGKKSS
jgi:hypothetical protein